MKFLSNWFWMKDTIGVYSYQLSAVSFQLLDQVLQHSLDFRDLPVQTFVVFGSKEFEVLRQQDMILKLTCGSHGDKAEPGELGIPITGTSLSYIGGNR